MGQRKVIVKQAVVENIAAIAWYIESKGLIATADKFIDSVYDYFFLLADIRKSFAVCREPSRALLGYKCITYKKKYTVAFIESKNELIICEFTSSKLIHW
jgi:hypothetical protein